VLRAGCPAGSADGSAAGDELAVAAPVRHRLSCRLADASITVATLISANTNTVPARLIQARDDESNAGMSLTSVARNVVSTFGATVSAAWRISANSFSRLTASFAGFTGTQSAQSAGTMSGAIGAPCGSSAICLSVEGIKIPKLVHPARTQKSSRV
jgi:hypothetical protein